MRATHEIRTTSWPVLEERTEAREPARKRVRRPDVSGYFALALVSALACGFFITGDLVRMHVPLAESLSFALHHPMSLLLAFCVALLAGLLAIGDV